MSSPVEDALVLIDVVNRFDHEDGEKLLRSFRERLPGLRAALRKARASGVPVVYVNDSADRWTSDAPGLVAAAVANPLGGAEIAQVKPEPEDPFLIKPRYSAFDHTALVLLLRSLEVERIILAGAATEMCVVQSAIDARELGFKVTILADACASVDYKMEQLALTYAKRVVGAFVIPEHNWQPRQP